MTEQKFPRVGTAVWIIKEGKVLLGKREAGAEKGSWCVPGGAIDLYEGPTAGAIREVMEETKMTIDTPRLIAVMNDADKENGSHWITLHFVANWVSGSAKDNPGEIGNWTWFTYEKLPENLFSATRNFVKNGYNPHNFN
jgi:8-oxo-dGTP diphosphatase